MLGRWPIEIIPDNPPTIAFAKPPSATTARRAAPRLQGERRLRRREREGGDPPPGRQPGGFDRTRPAAAGPPPQGSRGNELSRSVAASLGRACRSRSGSSRPTRSARPARASRCTWSCPSASFTNPVARAIIDQRKELAKDPASAEAVAEILGDLNERPALYRDDTVVFLALRLAAQQLRRDQGKDSIAGVEQLLWDTALRIEDGQHVDGRARAAPAPASGCRTRSQKARPTPRSPS